MNIEIKDVQEENIFDLINLCIPKDKKDDSLFIEGFNKKFRWCKDILNKYNFFAKIAYVNRKPKGLIQYLIKPEENIVEIKCIFVSEEEFLRKGIGKSLLFSLMNDFEKPNKFFNNEKPGGFINFPIDIPGRYTQSEFFKRYGFIEKIQNEFRYLFYPIKENFTYSLKESEYRPQICDKGKAIVFYDPSCPFCIYFSNKIIQILKDINSKIEIRLINQFEEKIEVEKRGKIYNCIVNQIPIKTFFLDIENFKKEVLDALKIDNI